MPDVAGRRYYDVPSDARVDSNANRRLACRQRPLVPPESGGVPSRLVAVVIGVLILGAAVWVIPRHRTSGLSASASRFVSVALGDGFTVFGLASLAFNMLVMILGKCDLDPTLDGLHLIPAMWMNEVWEGLISLSYGSFFLTSGGIALFDACIGSLIGLSLFPFRRLTTMSVVDHCLACWLLCIRSVGHQVAALQVLKEAIISLPMLSGVNPR